MNAMLVGILRNAEEGALKLLMFAACAGCVEALLPAGRLRRAAETLLGLLAAKLLLDLVFGLFGSA